MKIEIVDEKNNDLLEVMNAKPGEGEDPILEAMFKGVRYEMVVQAINEGRVHSIAGVKKPEPPTKWWHFGRRRDWKHWNKALEGLKTRLQLEQQRVLNEVMR